MSARATGWILIAVSAASFGVMGVLVKVTHREGVDRYSTLAWRFAIASAVLLPLAAAGKKTLPAPRAILGLLLFGSCGYVAHSLCFFIALEHASVSLTSLLFYIYPALVALAGAAFFRERLGLGKVAALAVALIGVALAVAPGGKNEGLGIALALACAGIYTIYLVVCSRVSRGVDPMTSATIIIVGAAILYGAIALARRSPLPPTSTGWMAVAAIGVISTAIAIATLFAAMGRIGATSAAAGATLEPVVTVLLGALILDEKLTAVQLGGGALIVAAVAWLATRRPAASP